MNRFIEFNIFNLGNVKNLQRPAKKGQNDTLKKFWDGFENERLQKMKFDELLKTWYKEPRPNFKCPKTQSPISTGIQQPLNLEK